MKESEREKEREKRTHGTAPRELSHFPSGNSPGTRHVWNTVYLSAIISLRSFTRATHLWSNREGIFIGAFTRRATRRIIPRSSRSLHNLRARKGRCKHHVCYVLKTRVDIILQDTRSFRRAPRCSFVSPVQKMRRRADKVIHGGVLRPTCKTSGEGVSRE